MVGGALALVAFGGILAGDALGQAKPAAAALQGTVSKVIDGDSLVVEPAAKDAKPLVVRIQNIDAPEVCQPWGTQAREALAERVKGKTVRLKSRGRDPHGRLLAEVEFDGQDIGHWMVVEGHAWSVRTRWDRGPLVKQERQAASLARGLWSQGKPVAPKEFRHAHGPCTG
jgi:endonuclease YncB( thermonuclease family)